MKKGCKDLNHKGQLLGMPMVMIFALIVGAMILAWGIYTIMDITDQANYIDLVDTIDDLRSNAEAFGNYDEGTSKKYVLDLPKEIEYICFYNSASKGECLLDGISCPSEFSDYNEIFGTINNVYVFPMAYDTSQFKIDEEFFPEKGNPECISNGNTALLKKQDGYVSITYYAI